MSRSVIWILGLSLSLFSCTQSQKHSPSNPANPSSNALALAKSNPSLIVEGYIEFSGPNNRWAGPSTFLIHMSTREANTPVISVIPAMTEEGETVNSPKLSIEEVREDLARLKGLLEEPSKMSLGCLNPIQIRLIQADGVLYEKQGCRGEKGWPRVASEIAHNVMEDVVLNSKKGQK